MNLNLIYRATRQHDGLLATRWRTAIRGSVSQEDGPATHLESRSNDVELAESSCRFADRKRPNDRRSIPTAPETDLVARSGGWLLAAEGPLSVTGLLSNERHEWRACTRHDVGPRQFDLKDAWYSTSSAKGSGKLPLHLHATRPGIESGTFDG